MKCTIQPVIQEVSVPLRMRDLPNAVLFAPLNGMNGIAGVMCSGELGRTVMWIRDHGSVYSTAAETSTSWNNPVRALEPGETVVLEND